MKFSHSFNYFIYNIAMFSSNEATLKPCYAIIVRKNKHKKKSLYH